jgi:hypothetical protein
MSKIAQTFGASYGMLSEVLKKLDKELEDFVSDNDPWSFVGKQHYKKSIFMTAKDFQEQLEKVILNRSFLIFMIKFGVYHEIIFHNFRKKQSFNKYSHPKETKGSPYSLLTLSTTNWRLGLRSALTEATPIP